MLSWTSSAIVFAIRSGSIERRAHLCAEPSAYLAMTFSGCLRKASKTRSSERRSAIRNSRRFFRSAMCAILSCGFERGRPWPSQFPHELRGLDQAVARFGVWTGRRQTTCRLADQRAQLARRQSCAIAKCRSDRRDDTSGQRRGGRCAVIRRACEELIAAESLVAGHVGFRDHVSFSIHLKASVSRRCEYFLLHIHCSYAQHSWMRRRPRNDRQVMIGNAEDDVGP